MKAVRILSSKRTFAGDLLNVAGHELRSPLTALRGRAEMLLRRLPDGIESQASREDTAEILHLAVRLDHDIEMYTVAGHLARGTFELAHERCDLGACLTRLAAVYAHTAGAGGISAPIPPESVFSQMDIKRFEMALGHLLLQACLASEVSYPVIRLQRMGPVAAISLTDAGPLPDAIAQALKLPPHALPYPDELAVLQVAVAHEVIEAQGGNVQAYAEDTGYVVSITLPGLLA